MIIVRMKSQNVMILDGDANCLPELLHALSEDGHGGVDRVGDDRNKRLRAVAGHSVRETCVKVRVDFEEVLAGHAGLAGHASRDHLGTKGAKWKVENSK